MYKLFNRRKFYFILIISIFLFLFLEFVFFLYFHNNNLNEKLSLYSEKRKSALSYNYFSNVDLVLPLPNVNMIHYSTLEFIDNYPTKDILNLGFGLFDDGIDKGKKVYAVAIGDSFTKGVGAVNNLENGWVELVEKKIEWIDIINLAGLGGSAVNQKFKYNNLKKFINHDLVIHNFYFAENFVENLTDFDGSHYISYLRDKFNLNDEETKQKIDELNIYHGYKPQLEYFMKNEIQSYTLGFVLKFIELLRVREIIPEHLLPDILTGQSDTYRNFLNTRMGVLSDDVFNLRERFESREKFEPIGVQRPIKSNIKLNGENFSVYKEFNDINLMEKLIKNSANLINNFYEEVNSDIKHKGTKFIFIIHPSKNSIYFPIFQNEIPEDKFVDFLYLKKNLKVILMKKY